VTDVAVYGVAIPNTDGRAGMAALVVNQDFDLRVFRRTLVNSLPGYARPVFVRLLKALQITGTFKLRKQELLTEGYDPSLVRDPLFIDNSAVGAYVAFSPAVLNDLRDGRLRV
jgi:fatty-acyl-CoA synthase